MLRRISLLFLVVTVLAPVSRADSISDLIEQGHYKRAEAALRPQLQENPNDPFANYLMSKVDIAFNRFDGAISRAEKAVSADGSRAEYHAQLAEALGAKTDDPKAGMLQKLSYARRMKQEAELALKLDPKNADANSDLLDFYLDAPGMAGGSKDKAKELATHVTQLDAPQGYLLQVQFARHEKRVSEVEQFYKQAIQTAPNNYNAQVGLASLYLDQEKPQIPRAEEHARLALKIDSRRVAAFVVLATAAAKQARWDDLDQLLADTEKNIPDDFSPHYQAGKTILLSGSGSELARAESCFRKYLTQTPEAGTPPLAAAHWRLGLVLEKENRKDEARKELQAAVELDPSLKEAQKDLNRLN
ncbi:MAG TPA: tetratricopeptide repeat protein [Candidatus Methylomirabilis sp.]|nr:tetratricopeptide repeat protein [Candidatus Methylomirabilis sp.]